MLLRGLIMNTTTNTTIEIIEFTDPVCTWCWGSEPVLRKLETRYGEQVKISYIMGGLVQDITSGLLGSDLIIEIHPLRTTHPIPSYPPSHSPAP